MDDNEVSNITQILSLFDNFVLIMENSLWIRFAKPEDIKNGFKLALFLEKTLNHFHIEKIISEFFIVLKQWWKTKNRTKMYNKLFFQFACDQLLIRFFQYDDISESSLDIAIRVYTSIFPKVRLKKVINDLVLLTSSREAITNFANANMSRVQLENLEYNLIVNSLSDMLQSNRESDVRKQVENKISLYKVESSLHEVIGMLAINTVENSEKKVQNIALEILLKKMADRSLLSKSFWLTLFKKVKVHSIAMVCENFQQFFISILNFIIYIGSMMKHENGTWLSDENVSLCPEITYEEVFNLMKSIQETSLSSKDFIKERLKIAQDSTNSPIWEKMKHELCL